MAELDITMPRDVAIITPNNKLVEEIAPKVTMTLAATSRPESVTNSIDVEMRQLTGTGTNVAMREDIPPDGGYGTALTA